MIRRTHVTGDAASAADYSACGTYRFALTRIWAEGPRLAYVLLNPSTATEVQNDPTVERCERRARALGYGGFRVVNLFAFRATDPQDLRRAAAPVGDGNDAVLLEAANWADQVLCGWGGHGAYLGRGAEVTALLRASGKALAHLGLTKAGAPRHPLYIGYAVQPQLWR